MTMKINDNEASAILIIADTIYQDHELHKLTPEEYYKTNLMEIVKQYTNKHTDQILAILNTNFDY